MHEFRQPTVAEAVDWIKKSFTLEYRRQCLLFWRNEYGDAFANQVEAEVKIKWKQRKSS